MICRMIEALRPSVNLTSPESRRPYRMMTLSHMNQRFEFWLSIVKSEDSHHEIVLHEIENKIEGALVFPRMARSVDLYCGRDN